MKAKIPPLLVLLFCGLLMWLMARFVEVLTFDVPNEEVLFWSVLAMGLLLLLAGVRTILKRKTVLLPNREGLSKVTTLITTGVFGFTRNPIYLGLAIMLVAWTIFLENWLSILGVIIFIAFITEFQIKPEEEALEKVFGDEYMRYRGSVRRWI